MPIVYNQSDFFDLVEGRSDEGFDPDPPKYKILVEGDSWVSHPLLRNLAHQLDLLGGDDFGILNLAVPGDTAANLLKRNGKQLKQIGQLIATKTHGYAFDLIFISAAGNDIVGEELLEYVDDYNDSITEPAQLLNAKFDKAMDTAVKGYENLIKLRNKSGPNKKTPIVTQAYCYLKPRRVGTKFFGKQFGQGWIKQYLDPKGIPEAIQAKLVVEMLSRFHDRLVELQEKYDNFHIVDTRKKLEKRGKPNVAWFYDEIHPTNEGFRRVASAIRKRMIDEDIWLG
jgi:hypothetical protein